MLSLFNFVSVVGTLMDCYDELGNRYQLPVYVLSAPTNLIEEASDSDTIQDPESASPGLELPIKFRLSHSNKDLKLYVRTTDTVWKVKKRIFEEEGIDPSRQRWFFSGRLLSDKMKIEDTKISKGFVVQVIVSPIMCNSTGDHAWDEEMLKKKEKKNNEVSLVKGEKHSDALT